MSGNLRAFLLLIRTCEGTADERGYYRHFGGSHFSDFKDHPRKVITAKLGSQEIHSSAAGAYQFLEKTWDRCKRALSLPDFSPASQDQAAIWLIGQRGALQDVEDGNLKAALDKCSWEWASLPPGRYGQPIKSYAECGRIFRAAGGITVTVQPAAAEPAGQNVEPTTAAPPTQAAGESSPSDPSPRPVAAPPAPTKERRMSPLLIPAIGAVIDAIPSLVRLFGSGSKVAERNAQAVDVVARVVKEATGLDSVAAGAEQVLADPATRAKVEQAVQARWYELQEVGSGVDGARKWAEQMTGGNDWRAVGYGALIGLLALLVLGGGGFLMAALMFDANTSAEQRGMLIGALVAFMSAVVGYFFGSSASSRQKDTTIQEQARR